MKCRRRHRISKVKNKEMEAFQEINKNQHGNAFDAMYYLRPEIYWVSVTFLFSTWLYHCFMSQDFTVVHLVYVEQAFTEFYRT